MADWPPGHTLVTRTQTPSGYRYVCECGAGWWSKWDEAARQRYHDHLDEEAANRVRGTSADR